MSDTQPGAISEVLGYSLSDDARHILIGFKQPSGSEFTLALADEHLHDVIASLLAARDLFPENAQGPSESALPFEAHTIKIGNVKDSQQLIQTFRIEGGGSMSFIFDRKLGIEVFSALKAVLSDNRQPQSTVSAGLTPKP
jgi:uncharacterized lipoprotein YbaY